MTVFTLKDVQELVFKMPALQWETPAGQGLEIYQLRPS